MVANLLFIALGGAIGSVLRYLVTLGTHQWTESSFPVGTLAVNVSGCLLTGLVAALFTGPVLVREEFRLAILIGVLGGYTTFSAFGRETLALLTNRQYLFAFSSFILNNAGCLFAVWLGHRLGQKWFGA